MKEFLEIQKIIHACSLKFLSPCFGIFWSIGVNTVSSHIANDIGLTKQIIILQCTAFSLIFPASLSCLHFRSMLPFLMHFRVPVKVKFTLSTLWRNRIDLWNMCSLSMNSWIWRTEHCLNSLLNLETQSSLSHFR